MAQNGKEPSSIGCETSGRIVLKTDRLKVSVKRKLAFICGTPSYVWKAYFGYGELRISPPGNSVSKMRTHFYKATDNSGKNINQCITYLFPASKRLKHFVDSGPEKDNSHCAYSTGLYFHLVRKYLQSITAMSLPTKCAPPMRCVPRCLVCNADGQESQPNSKNFTTVY